MAPILLIAIAVVAFIIILSVLVFVHELGHFVVAKRSGITVEEFAIGFPPRAFKVWQDEGKITLDGHEFIIGRKISVPRSIQPGAKVIAETEIDPDGRLMITKLALVERAPMEARQQEGSEARFMNMVSSDGEAVDAADNEPTVIVDAIERPTEYAVNWVPLGGYVRMVGEEDPSAPGSFASKSKRTRFAVLVAGSLMNLVAAVVFFILSAMSGVPQPGAADTIVEAVVPNTPAAEAGLLANDIIFGADEATFEFPGDLIQYIGEVKGEETLLQVRRGEETLTVPIVPRLNPPPGQGSMGIRIRYDNIQTERVFHSFSEAIVWGGSQTVRYIGLVAYLPTVMFQERNLPEGEKTIPTEAARPTGPVGIFQQISGAVESVIQEGWWFPVLWLTAVLSTALAITNLLPLPALDGGRILFVIIEAIRGRRIAPEKEGAIHFIGMALLLTLMLVITYYDVSNPLPVLDWANPF